MENIKSPYLKLSQGALAGLVATLPMTIFMRSAWKRLPEHEKYALPPRQITRKVIKPVRKRSERTQKALTLFLHFMFGAAAGLIYGAVEEKVPVPPAVKGPLAGMVVWTGSYLGWIPALGILPSAVEHPRRRNLLMIVAHLIWGLTLGAFARMFNSGIPSGTTYIDLE
jgi:uncharacterized membrane protein YagU involved in acid resistance